MSLVAALPNAEEGFCEFLMQADGHNKRNDASAHDAPLFQAAAGNLLPPNDIEQPVFDLEFAPVQKDVWRVLGLGKRHVCLLLEEISHPVTSLKEGHMGSRGRLSHIKFLVLTNARAANWAMPNKSRTVVSASSI
jgi:hypothetical protein